MGGGGLPSFGKPSFALPELGGQGFNLPGMDKQPFALPDITSGNTFFQSLSSTLPTLAANQKLMKENLKKSLEGPKENKPAAPGTPAAQPAVGGPAPTTGGSTFLAWAAAQAKAALAEAGLPEALAPIMAGIAANETGYGNPRYVQGNNYFGIKGGSGPAVPTWEVINGQRVNTTAQFRQYENPTESFRDFIRFLRENPRYANAIQQVNDPTAFIRGVHAAGYATDPNWSSQVLNIASQVPAVLAAAPRTPLEEQRAGERTTGTLRGVSQNELGLPANIAQAFCGPSAMDAFVSAFGRAPTATEALNLGREWGWTPSDGMSRGPTSVVGMINDWLRREGVQGVQASLGTPDPNRIISELQAGRPVLIDTGGAGGNNGHYFQIIGYNQASGTFLFGDAVGKRSGNVGQTLQGIANFGYGAPRAAIYGVPTGG